MAEAIKRRDFIEWLDEQVQRAGGLRRAAARSGVSHATLLRGLQGDDLSLRTLEGISGWTGVSLVRLLRMYGEDIEDEYRVESALARVLDQRPELRDNLQAAIGALDDEALAQVIQFIRFLASQKRPQTR
jgi:transcriptional regulator with XRE-family HTH domain